MASKENQKALNYLLRKYCNYKKCKECPIKKQCDLTIEKYGKTLQKAIDDLELLENIVDVEMEGNIIKSIIIKKRVGEELENGK